MDKYAQYFKGHKILPIPELVVVVQLKTLFFIITDLRFRRLAGIKKDTFKELLKAAGIPARYFYRRSFATWDVLLPLEELAVKLTGSNVSLKFFLLHPGYMGRRRIKVTKCNGLIQINGDLLAACLSEDGDVEDVMAAKWKSGTAHGDYFFTMCLNRGGFQAIPRTLEYEDQVLMVVVEGRRPQCWYRKQLGHFSGSCPQKTTKIQHHQQQQH